MGKMVSGLIGGGSGRASRVTAIKDTQAKNDQAVAVARQQQEQAAAGAATEASLGRARRSPRGRRIVLGEMGSKLG